MTWGEYYRMMKGYNRRFKRDQHTTATTLAAIYNTIPRAQGKTPFAAKDFIEGHDYEKIDADQRKELARLALERSAKFDNGGVIYDTQWRTQNG
jgi:hypothetical protein